MSDQHTIVMYEGDATPATVILRALPVTDVPPLSVCYLYSVIPYPGLSGDPGIITLRENDITPTAIRLLSPVPYIISSPNVIIYMRDPMNAGGAPPPIPPVPYYGILKRWTGGAWVKALLRYWTGSTWTAAVLKRWTGSEWVLVDATGV